MINGVVQLAGLLQIREQATEVVVDSLHAAEVLFQVGVVSEACVLLVACSWPDRSCRGTLGIQLRQIPQIGTTRIAPADRRADVGNQFVVGTAGGDRAKLRVSLPKRFRFRDLDVAQIGFVARLRCRSSRAEPCSDASGRTACPGRSSCFQPFEREVGDRIGRMLAVGT